MKSLSEFINNSELQIQEKKLLEIFNPNDILTIMDIGSCEGESSIRYSKLFSKAKIYAFEPLIKNFEKLTFNIKEYNCSNIFPFQLCLSDKDGQADFFISSAEKKNTEVSNWDFGNKSSSLLQPDKTLEIYNWLEFKDKELVRTQTLNTFCKQEKLNQVDFIHLDVQGAELLVLRGANEFLENLKTIWLEVEVIPLYKDQPLKKDIEKFLKENGFSKIIDTVNHVSGDQFWINMDYYISIIGKKNYYKVMIKMELINLKINAYIKIKKITRRIKLGEKFKKLINLK